MEKARQANLMVIKWIISKTISRGIPLIENAKDFLEDIGQKFKKSDKERPIICQATFPMQSLIILEVQEITFEADSDCNQAKRGNLLVTDDFVVHTMLDSHCWSMNSWRLHILLLEKWSINELISVCVQEEERRSKKRA